MSTVMCLVTIWVRLVAAFYLASQWSSNAPLAPAEEGRRKKEEGRLRIVRLNNDGYSKMWVH